MASLPRHRIAVWHWTDDDDGSEVVTVQLLDKNGTLLDYTSADQYKLAYGDLNKLHVAARRSALGVSKVISEVEEELAALRRGAR